MRLCLIFLLLLTACSGPDPQVNNLRLNLSGEPLSLDPGKAHDVISQLTLLMLFEGLTRIDGEGTPTLAAAESIEVSNDGRQYTFHLREAVWSNGDPVTAHDFVYAWRRALDPKFPSQGVDLLFAIKGAKEFKLEGGESIGLRAANASTLVVELEQPIDDFLLLTAHPTYFPVHQGVVSAEPQWAADAGPLFVTNGPFFLQQWDHSRRLSLPRNPDFWEPVPLDGIEIFLVEDETTELHMFEQGELDWAGAPMLAVPYDAVDRLREQGLFHSTPSSVGYWFEFNRNVSPFNNVKVRRAFACALDRQRIVTHITRDTHRVADGIVPTAPTHSNASNPFAGNARALLDEGLAELGLSHAALEPIVLSSNSGNDLQIAQAVQAQWQEQLGVKVVLRLGSWTAHLDRVARGDFQVARYSLYARVATPRDFLQRVAYQHPDLAEEFYEHLEKGDFASAEAALIEEMPVAPLLFLNFNHLRAPDLEGVVFPPTGLLDFRWTRRTSPNLTRLGPHPCQRVVDGECSPSSPT